MDLNTAVIGIDRFIMGNKDSLKSLLRGTRNDNEDNLWVDFSRYHQETSIVLSNTFVNNVGNLKTRLNNFVDTSLDSLNNERYIIIDNVIKEFFYNAVNTGLFDYYCYVDVKELSDSDKKELLEHFTMRLINEDFLGNNIEEFILVGFDEQYVEHPAVRELLGYAFLSDTDYTNCFEIIKNHIEAINMITEGSIPPYDGELLNVNNLDILSDDHTGVDSQLAPEHHPEGEVPSYDFNYNHDNTDSDIN